MKNVLLKYTMAFAIMFVCQSVLAQEIYSFTLINAKEDVALRTMSETDTVNVSVSNTTEFSIRANTTGVVGSVVFKIDDAIVNTGNAVPYTLLGNLNGNYQSWVPELKTYKISGSVYSLPQGQGSLLHNYTVSVTFVEDAAIEPVGPNVQSFVLINADTDEDIAEISEGSVFILEEIGTENLNIRAEVDSLAESVVFDYQSVKNYHTENLWQYAIGANDDNDYRPWQADLGVNTLTATAYSMDHGAGNSGDSLTVNFEILEKNPVVTPSFEMRINSGGPAMMLNDSVQFKADTLFVGYGKSYSNYNILDILETNHDSIYKTERTSSNSLKAFGYSIPVANGEYEVKLHFAEIYWGATNGGAAGAGKRVVTVRIEDEEVISNLDMNAEFAPMTAIIKSFKATVTDSILNIDFGASVNQPKVSAIEIFGFDVQEPSNDCEWNELADSSSNKSASQSVSLNEKLYVIGNVVSDSTTTSVTEVYDVETNTWSTLKSMPLIVADMSVVGVEDEIWVIAGMEYDSLKMATNKVQIYNTVTDAWSFGPSLPSSRASGAAIYNNEKLHYLGGVTSDGNTRLSEHLVLDLSDIDAGWVVAANLTEARSHLSSASVDGKIYAIGGKKNDSIILNTLEEYDPVSDAWLTKASLSLPRSHMQSSAIVHNNKIIIVGGKNGELIDDSIAQYDVETDSWSELCVLPVNLLNPAAKIIGNQLIVVKGVSTVSMDVEPVEIVKEDKKVRVLVYHETAEFRHKSIQAGIDMVYEFGEALDWVVADSQTSDVFTSENLANYDVVMWVNTTGDDILTIEEQAAFESFIQSGGGFVGVHSATDTYRSGSWSWYNDLVGAIVQVSPYHTSSNFSGTIDVVGEHSAVGHLSAEWNKNDEYYYWERNGGYLYSGNINLLNVRTTGANSYDASRPVTWYKEYDGGRSFYTALGHNIRDYQTDEDFRTMVKEAIIWAAQGTKEVVVKEEEEEVANTNTLNNAIKLFPNPIINDLTIESELLDAETNGVVSIFGMDGNLRKRKFINRNDNQIALNELTTGYYVAIVQFGEVSERHMIYKQ